MFTKDQQLLSEIAFALTSNNMDGAAHFADLTTGDVTFIQHEYMFEEDEITEDEINAHHDWEQEQIRTYLHHDLIHIEPLHSSVSFRIMESFADTRTNKRELQRLETALTRKRPFANFRYACEDLGILQQWYDFKNEAEARQAQQWLKDNDLEIRDGKIQRK